MKHSWLSVAIEAFPPMIIRTSQTELKQSYISDDEINSKLDLYLWALERPKAFFIFSIKDVFFFRRTVLIESYEEKLVEIIEKHNTQRAKFRNAATLQFKYANKKLQRYSKDYEYMLAVYEYLVYCSDSLSKRDANLRDQLSRHFKDKLFRPRPPAPPQVYYDIGGRIYGA